jgi:hypothetical protein
MKETNQVLIDSIKIFLFQEQIVLSSLPDEVLLAARDNGLSAMLYHAAILSKIAIPEALKRDYYHYIQRDTLQQMAIHEIKEALNQETISHVFLKGSHLKTLYHPSYVRGMGDIDILIDPLQMQRVHQVFETLKYVNTHNSPNHDTFEKGKDVIVEIHPKLNSEFDERFEGLFGHEWEETVLVSGSTYRFCAEFECSYLIYHLAKHFSNSGIGIRSVLDIGIYYVAYAGTFDNELFLTWLEKGNLTIFASHLFALLVEVFGFPPFACQELFPVCHKTDLDSMLEWISFSGVHGKAKEFNASVAGMASQTAKTSSTKKGKRLYILKLLFPPRKQLVSTYPFLKNWGILLPLAWGKRAFVLIFRKTKRSIHKLKSLQVNNEEVKEAANLFQRIGL